MDMDAAIVSGSDTAFREDEEEDTNEEEEEEYGNEEYDYDEQKAFDSSSSSSCSETKDEVRTHRRTHQDHHRYNVHSHNIHSSLYDPNQDDEDEAYVYKHLRSGVEEQIKVQLKVPMTESSNRTNHNASVSSTTTTTIMMSSHASSSPSSSTVPSYTLQSMLKPRHSDAILSCPCCFQIVCMDCQRHETYRNQYRAMFVMNIGVDWNHIVHTTTSPADWNDGERTDWNVSMSKNKRRKGRLLEKDPFEDYDEEDGHDKQKEEEEEQDQRRVQGQQESLEQNESHHHVYYSVHCLQCNTEVAALGMHDEVYHFFGCLVSG